MRTIGEAISPGTVRVYLAGVGLDTQFQGYVAPESKQTLPMTLGEIALTLLLAKIVGNLTLWGLGVGITADTPLSIVVMRNDELGIVEVFSGASYRQLKAKDKSRLLWLDVPKDRS